MQFFPRAFKIINRNFQTRITTRDTLLCSGDSSHWRYIFWENYIYILIVIKTPKMGKKRKGGGKKKRNSVGFTWWRGVRPADGFEIENIHFQIIREQIPNYWCTIYTRIYIWPVWRYRSFCDGNYIIIIIRRPSEEPFFFGDGFVPRRYMARIL